MGLSDLPIELILRVAHFLDCEIDINSLARTSLHLYGTLNGYTYKRLHKNPANRALDWAVLHRKPACVSKLLAKGFSARLPGKDGCSTFELAVHIGYADVVRAFLEYDASLLEYHQELSEPYRTPDEPVDVFINAIECGNEAVVRVLIEYGAVIERAWEHEETSPLALATFHRYASIVKLLIEGGCNPQGCLWGIWIPPEHEVQAISRYPKVESAPKLSEMEFLQFLVDMGVDPELRGGHDRPWIFRKAIYTGNISVVEFLLEKGIRVDESELDDLLMHLFIAACDNPAVTTLLPKLVDIDKLIMSGMATGDVRHYVSTLARDSSVEPIRCALRQIKASAPTDVYQEHLDLALCMALQRGHSEMVKFLLEHGVVPSGPKHARAWERAISLKHNKVIKLLMDTGADILSDQCPDVFRCALTAGNWQMIKWLCDRKLSPGQELQMRWASLLQCVKYGEESEVGILAMLRTFLQLGFTLSPESLDHRKAFLRTACSAKVDALEVFLDAGFDVDTNEAFNCQAGYPIGSPVILSFSALVYAASAEDCNAAEEAVDFLLARGATLDFLACPSSPFRSPIESLAYKSNYPWTEFQRLLDLSDEARCRAAALLLRKGANPYECSPLTPTPLRTAAMCNFLEMAKILVDYFEETQAPFPQVKCQVWGAIRTHSYESDMNGQEEDSTETGLLQSETARFLYRYYWRKRCPPPQ